VTADHLPFQALVDQLPDDATLIAPDLRGRGGSGGIAGPSGMPQHADDLIAVLDHLGVDSATVVGQRWAGPWRLSPPTVTRSGSTPCCPWTATCRWTSVHSWSPIEDLVARIIGPSLRRLRMTFTSVEEYLDLWRPHPALRDRWKAYFEAYLRYDLVGAEPEQRSRVREEAALADSVSDLRDDVVEKAVRALRHPRGLPAGAARSHRRRPPLRRADRRAVAQRGAGTRRPDGAGRQPTPPSPSPRAARRRSARLSGSCAAGHGRSSCGAQECAA
jgi:hypothetical protein